MNAASGQPSLVCPACASALTREKGGSRCLGCGTGYPEHDGILSLASKPEGAPGYDLHFFRTLPFGSSLLALARRPADGGQDIG